MADSFKKHCLNCNCGDLEHQIWFRFFDDDPIKNREMYVEMHFPRVSFFNRLKKAIKYIFDGNSGCFTDIVVKEKDISELEEFFYHYRNDYNE